jgi:hypothetical protein
MQSLIITILSFVLLLQRQWLSTTKVLNIYDITSVLIFVAIVILTMSKEFEREKFK